jgi:hypothetical protein
VLEQRDGRTREAARLTEADEPGEGDRLRPEGGDDAEVIPDGQALRLGGGEVDRDLPLRRREAPGLFMRSRTRSAVGSAISSTMRPSARKITRSAYAAGRRRG